MNSGKDIEFERTSGRAPTSCASSALAVRKGWVGGSAPTGSRAALRRGPEPSLKRSTSRSPRYADHIGVAGAFVPLRAQAQAATASEASRIVFLILILVVLTWSSAEHSLSWVPTMQEEE